MRFSCMLLLAVLLTCLSIQAHAIEPGEIAVPSISAPNMDMPKPIITSPNMLTPEPKPKPLVMPDNNSSQAQNLTSSMSNNQIQMAKAKSNDVSGKWLIKFDNRPDSLLDLTLWSSGASKIMGYGALTKGGAKNSVTASGSLLDEELVLTVKSAESEYASESYDECDFDLFLANNTLSGTYILRAGGEFIGDGNATASKH